MNKSELNKEIIKATKWSTITQVIGKLVVPITNMILARILVPEAFGVIATINMVISFADMFTDAGFQKYIVQHKFNSTKEKNEYVTVAFWTNLVISLIIWLLISIFSDNISNLVGSPGLSNVLVIAGIVLPLTSFSSIQMALFRRNFQYKTLFYIRIISIFIPFIITIPLALLGFSYWALIISNIISTLINAVILTIKSTWKPTLFYRINILKNMLSFSLWSLAESVATWLISWCGTFIVGTTLNPYYIGLYKTSISTVNGITGIVTDSTTSVLFSSLSRIQDNKCELKKIFLKFQRGAAYILLPMGIGIYIYRDLVTSVFLGSQWKEASLFIGLWGLSSSISIIFGQYCNEVYRAIGKPKIGLISQILHLVILVPVLFISSKYGFTVLIYSRCIVRLEYIFVNVIIMNYVIKISVRDMLSNIIPSIYSSLIMGVCGFWLKYRYMTTVEEIVSIIICMLIYFISMAMFKSVRSDMKKVIITLK